MGTNKIGGYKWPGTVTIKLTHDGDELDVWPSVEVQGGIGIALTDSDEPRTNIGTASPDEWDAFCAAGNRALGREAPTALAALANRIETEPGAPVDLSGVCHEGREEDIYGKGYAKGRADAAVMVREAVHVDCAEVEALRSALSEALDGWAQAHFPAPVRRADAETIARLRKALSVSGAKDAG